jgi:uncharacterized membrane protein
VAVAVVVVVLLSVVVVAIVAWPMLRPRSTDPAVEAEDAGEARRREGREALDRSLAAIREIDMDHRAGHLSDEDFAALDAAERARAVELLKRLDEEDAEEGG